MDSFGIPVCLTELCIHSTEPLPEFLPSSLSIFKVQCGLKIAHSVGLGVFVGRFFGKEFSSNGMAAAFNDRVEIQ